MDSNQMSDEHSDSTRKYGTENLQDWVAGWLTINRLVGDLWTHCLQKDAQKAQETLLNIQTESRLLSNTIKLIQESDHAKNVFR